MPLGAPGTLTERAPSTVEILVQEAFQRWLADNEERLTRTYPEGTKYLGTFTVHPSPDEGGGGAAD